MATFTAPDGLELSYLDSGSGPAVVLLHGFIANAHLNWVAPGIVAALVDAGHRVIAPDARGHGSSEKPHDPARYGEMVMARDVSALLSYLDIEAASLVGYSMGAVVAALVAAQDKRITRLILGGVGAGMVEVGGLDRRAVAPEAVAEALLADPAPPPTTQAGAFRAFADFVGADRQALAAQVRAANSDRLPLEDITVPTMVLAGGADPLAARPGVLASAVKGAVLTILPGDHLGVVRDTGFAPSIVDFITR